MAGPPPLCKWHQSWVLTSSPHPTGCGSQGLAGTCPPSSKHHLISIMKMHLADPDSDD